MPPPPPPRLIRPCSRAPVGVPGKADEINHQASKSLHLSEFPF